MAPQDFTRVIRDRQHFWQCNNCGDEIMAKYKPKRHHCNVHRRSSINGDNMVFSPFLNYEAQYGSTPGPSISPGVSQPPVIPQPPVVPQPSEGFQHLEPTPRSSQQNSRPTRQTVNGIPNQSVQYNMQPQVQQNPHQNLQSQQYMEWMTFRQEMLKQQQQQQEMLKLMNQQYQMSLEKKNEELEIQKELVESLRSDKQSQKKIRCPKWEKKENFRYYLD